MSRPTFPLLRCFSFAIVLGLPLLGITQELPKRFKQYKRVHQDALKKIVKGDTVAAIADLENVLDQLPIDAESHYMLAVAYARSGNQEAALGSVQRALESGLPVDRFIAGTITGLESIQDAPPMKELRDTVQRPAHGPMLGCISGTSVKVWVRTSGSKTVSATAWEPTDLRATKQSESVKTNKQSDFTGVVEIKGLKPNTKYDYSVSIDGTPYREATFHFRTLAATGSPVKFRIAFGGGAGFVPQHEHMWDTIRAEQPDVLLLLGDNLYSDAPKIPEMQHYCYYRRQSRPEYRRLIASTPVFSIWDDHDFGTNDCSGGPEINEPSWKLPVYRVFRNNWVNPYYGGGEAQPGCNYDFYLGDVHFIMLDGRYYRHLNRHDAQQSTMLGPAQKKWLLKTIKASAGRLLVLCSPVPWVFKAKGDSQDTWNGFQQEREEIFDFLTAQQRDGVILMSADRHRSDLWKIDRPNDYPLYEFNSSRLTNQHVHKEMAEAVFSYNKKQSFGTIDIDTTKPDPTITYRVMSIDGEQIHKFVLTRSSLISKQ